MDDGLILNITSNTSAPAKSAVKKSGRWTDRLKNKRVLKRKSRSHARPAEQVQAQEDSDLEVQPPRPVKRPRQGTKAGGSSANDGAAAAPKPPTQIISSLFSYNPKVDVPEPLSRLKVPSKPSNAPLASSSGFSELGLHPLLVSHLESKMGVTKPTSIQRAVLPIFTTPTSSEMASQDVFIQSQTGSGKTLSFLLPIINDLFPLSTHSYIDRSIGTLAIIIAPTRELAKQISDVLDSLLKLKLRQEGQLEAVESSTRFTRWLVSGLLSGGATRTHEKARLRKGIPILVSTPGRLLDHLQKTSSFNVGKCKWLVLDEADRLMELGFEETIKGIIHGLDGRRKLALQAVKEGKSLEVGGWDWERRRRTILCSATIREDVQKLAGTTLVDPIMIKAFDVEKAEGPGASHEPDTLASAPSSEKFTPPSQLSQRYVVVPLKLRLVALVALLRLLLAQKQARKGTKIIVFLSCTDSVDFHWRLLGGSTMDDEEREDLDSNDDQSEDDDKPSRDGSDDKRISVQSPLLPDTLIFRLHGSLPTPTRLASIRNFSSPSSTSKGDTSAASSSVLLCTSVASRGLDLPFVRAVVQYDLPTEGGATEYVHRVGRTARAGKGGEAWSMIAPSESEWVKWVEKKMHGEIEDGSSTEKQASVTLEGTSVENILSQGFGGHGTEYEARATDVQLSFERWVLRRKEHSELARRAFLSHMRAYSTHPSNEKHIFHVRHLHIGHLAKAFALRDAPKSITEGGKKGASKSSQRAKSKASKPASNAGGRKSRDWDTSERTGDTERRMTEIVRAQGRMSKKGGKMMSSGTAEFQIASGTALEKLVQGNRI
ncbi:P-loop containing nucleoside triphosphate hydrolase protein [Phlebopus sp. FC_14]|nr:P-loop containing nucleoside triphosphate hydrolase protein [Phlebopus sp. FC_14]